MPSPVIWYGEDGKLLAPGEILKSDDRPLAPAGRTNLIRDPDGIGGLDKSGTDDVGDWIDSGTGTTATRTTTTAKVPNSTVKTSAILITNDGSGTDYTRYRFRVPAGSRNMELGMFWFQLVGADYTAGDFDLQLYNYSDNYSSDEVEIITSIANSSGDTEIPALNGKLGPFTFSADDREYYELRVVRTAGSAYSDGVTETWLAINSVTVTPDPFTVVGVPETPWADAGTVAGDVTNGPSTVSVRESVYRRIGSSMHWRAVLEAGASSDGSASAMTVAVPFGLTIDTSLLDTSSRGTIQGNAFWEDSGSSLLKVIYARPTSTTTIGFRKDNATTYGGDSFDAGDYLHIDVILPIAEWSGSAHYGTNGVEYAYNAATGGATDSTSFGYDQAGGQFPTSEPVTTTIERRVEFRTARKPGDMIAMQIDPDGTGNWLTVGDGPSTEDMTNSSGNIITGRFYRYDSGSTNRAGVAIRQWVSDTQVDVIFGKKASYIGGSSPVTTAWTDTGISSARWRLVKVTAGGASGFGHATPAQTGLVKAEKQYVHGTDFTITSDAAATVAIVRGVAIPYQTYDGAWRLRLTVALTHGSDASFNITISGVTFKNVSGYNQPLTTRVTDGSAYASPNTDDIAVSYDAAKTGTQISGDVELESKPTWAD